MLDFLVKVLASSAVTAALVVSAAWLSRTWIKERLAKAIEHEYASRLETLKAELSAKNATALEAFRSELAKEQAVTAAATSSFLAARAAAHDRTLDAVHELWKAFLGIRKLEPSPVGATNFLTPDEIRGMREMPQFKDELAKLSLDKVFTDKLFLPEVEGVRPFVGDVLWSLFFGYRALVGRMCFLFAPDGPGATEGKVVYYLDDPVVVRILESLLTSEQFELVKSQPIGAYGLARSLIEQKAILAARRVIEGASSADAAMQQSLKILRAGEDALRKTAK